MKHSFFPRLKWTFNGGSFNVVVDVTWQQVGQHHCGQQVDGVAWLSIDLLWTARDCFSRLLVWVVLLFNNYTKPAKTEGWGKLYNFEGKQSQEMAITWSFAWHWSPLIGTPSYCCWRLRTVPHWSSGWEPYRRINQGLWAEPVVSRMSGGVGRLRPHQAW